MRDKKKNGKNCPPLQRAFASASYYTTFVVCQGSQAKLIAKSGVNSVSPDFILELRRRMNVARADSPCIRATLIDTKGNFFCDLLFGVTIMMRPPTIAKIPNLRESRSGYRCPVCGEVVLWAGLNLDAFSCGNCTPPTEKKPEQKKWDRDSIARLIRRNMELEKKEIRDVGKLPRYYDKYIAALQAIGREMDEKFGWVAK